MPPKPMGKAAKGPAAPLEPDPAASVGGVCTRSARTRWESLADHLIFLSPSFQLTYQQSVLFTLTGRPQSMQCKQLTGSPFKPSKMRSSNCKCCSRYLWQTLWHAWMQQTLWRQKLLLLRPATVQQAPQMAGMRVVSADASSG